MKFQQPKSTEYKENLVSFSVQFSIEGIVLEKVHVSLMVLAFLQK